MINFLYLVLFVISDRLTKHLAVKYLMPIGSAKVLDGIFNLTYVENRGVAFGLFQNMHSVIVPLNILIVALCTWLMIKAIKNKKRLFAFSINLIISGAIGNIIDKICYGYVVDFLEFAFIDFPVFNLADILVCTGAFLTAIIILFTKDGDIFDNKK